MKVLFIGGDWNLQMHDIELVSPGRLPTVIRTLRPLGPSDFVIPREPELFAAPELRIDTYTLSAVGFRYRTGPWIADTERRWFYHTGTFEDAVAVIEGHRAFRQLMSCPKAVPGNWSV